MVVRHKYCSSKTYSTGTAGVVGSTNAFTLNSLYDPDISGVGHQPYGYDEMTPWYQAIYVTDVQVQITVSSSSDNGNFLCWSVRPALSTEDPAGATLEAVSEKDNFNYMLVAPPTSGVPHTTVRLPSIQTFRLEGLTREQYLGNPNYRQAPGANAALQPYLFVGIGNCTGNNATTAIITVELIYTALWQGRKNVAQS